MGFCHSEASLRLAEHGVVRNLVSKGFAPVDIIPGNTDTNTKHDYIYLVGRNEDSGTRIDTFANTGVGVNPATVTQAQLGFTTDFSVAGGLPTGGYSAASSASATLGSFIPSGASAGIATIAASNTAGTSLPTKSGGSTSSYGAASFQRFPQTALNTEPNIHWGTGHSGYIAGGDVANVLSAFNPGNVFPSSAAFKDTLGLVSGSKVYLVGYVGLADAVSVAYGTPLAFDGVSPTVSNAPTPIENGTYPVWSEEHFFYLGSTSSNPLSGNTLTVAQAIADNLYNNYVAADKNGNFAAPGGESTVVSPGFFAIPGTFDSAGIYLQDMKVTTSSDGGAYTLSY